MVDKQIKQLLHEHDCVIIPDFGGLIARYVAARIHPVKHALIPPSKRIAFNEKLVLNDGLLISSIAHSRRISQDEATQLVADFVQQAKRKLQEENRFMLENIGTFRYNAEQRLEFEYIETENLLDSSFGLPELVARPLRASEPAVLRTLIKERQPELATTKPTFRSRFKKIYTVAAGLMLGGLTISALYLLSLQTDYNLSSLNPVSLIGLGSAAPGGANFSKYSPDYVPFTEEERLAWYQTVSPVKVVEELGTPKGPLFQDQEFVSEAKDDSVALADGLDRVVEVPGNNDVEEEVKAAPVVEDKPSHILSGKTGRWYIITGGFSTMENAEVKLKEIQQKKQSGKILIPAPGHKLYRVSAADFATPEEAAAAIGEFRKTYGETIWVLNN